MFDDFMTDRITIRARDGATYTDVAASVQTGKIFTQRTDIPSRPGDHAIRQTPAGVDEVFVVDDPGYHKGTGEIPDSYQMRVHREDATSPPSGMVVYNVAGPNARVNVNSVDASTNIIDQAPSELFQALREAIQARVQVADDREKLLAKTDELELETGKGDFGRRYREFIALAANHMEALGPFIPALAKQLTGG